MRLAITLISAAAFMAPAWGQMCTTSTIRGTYGVTCSGFISPAPNAPQVPFSAIGTINTDWDGNITGTAKASIGGTIVDQKVTGTAAIKTDCTGTVSYVQTINGQPAPNLNIAFHVVDNGKEIRGMSVDPGSTMVCNLQLLSR